MPPVATPPPASSTVKEVRIVDSGPPKPPPAPTRELRASDIGNLPGETRPGSPDKPRPSLRENLEKRAKPIGGEIISQPGDQPKPDAKPPVESVEDDGGEEAPPALTAKEGEQPPAKPALDPKTGKPVKANPWKLYDAEKKARATAEAEAQRLRSAVMPDQERGEVMKRMEAAEKRATDLENEIRFVSYEKSTEFKEQYQAPYEAAWKRATTELAEISITDPATNQPRAVTSQDILELVNLPLGKAREIADEVFGKFADDVMGHRKEIRGLFEKQNEALKQARENGGIREKQRQEQYQKQNAEVAGFVQTAWKKANDEFLADPVNGEYFKPKEIAEGATATPEESEWNEALERGFKLVDEAWGSNAMKPGLKPEERQAIIKKNAAVRNRAAAFGPLKRQNKRLLDKVKQLEKDLGEYAESTPGAGGSAPQGRISTGVGPMESFRERLRKKAH